MMRSLVRGMIVAALLVGPQLAQAQSYPNKPIKLVVPFPAGGPADTIARVLTEKMAPLLGQPIIIESRAGAGGVTGIAAVAKAEPDGYTIGLSSAGPLAITPVLSELMPYDVHKDLKLLTQVVEVPELLVVADNVPARTFGELIALAKSKPSKLNFASTGVGGVPHMAGELLKVSAGVDIEHVPYRGAAPAVNDLLGGHVNMMFADIPVLLGNVTAGKLRALAIGSAKRAPSAPDVPTTAELGMPEVLANNWYGLVAPSGIPGDIAAKISSAAVEALNSPEVKDKLALQGATTVGSTGEQFSAHVKAEMEKWAQVGKAGGVKLQ
ncbi:tripartite-type tricarboxylate transporter receptor subunit TctC [Bradyrhizobium sp. AZCC 1610]|uniref:Bug family tripartite tricarboxylate transporter substrate binding protein n=1 Tax=Bradyrhizobium sp. AZCC 1610 TaxID=3117020 RepID=UPI002FF256A1